MNKIAAILTLIIFMTSCVSVPLPKPVVITAESEPYKDIATPLAGSFLNGENIKGAVYVTVTILSMLSSLLFAPIQENGKGIIPIEDVVAVPLSLSLLGVGVSTALIVSPIDTAISYHTRNKKIIDLNGIEWPSKTNLTKYQAIKKHREDIILNQIEGFRKRFADDSITVTDIYIISSDERLSEGLKIEVEGYVKRKNKEKEQEAGK